MASTTVVKVKVQELSKYGFKANDRYVGYSKLFKDQARVVPGAEFDAEFYVADSGKEYLNKILSEVPSTPSVAVADTERAKKFTPKFNKPAVAADSEKMSKADWSAKDRSQLIGGLSHDAAQLVLAAITVGVDVSKALEMHKDALVGLLKLREEVK